MTSDCAVLALTPTLTQTPTLTLTLTLTPTLTLTHRVHHDEPLRGRLHPREEALGEGEG